MKKNSEFVGVDEKYIPEDAKYVDEPLIEDKEKIKKFTKKFGIGFSIYLGIFFVIFIATAIFIGSKILGGTSSINVRSFNSSYERRTGTQNGYAIEYLLDDIVTNNKTGKKHIISVVYNGVSTTEPDEIVKIKHSLERGTRYEVSLDYDDKGYVNKATIYDIKE